MNYSKLTKSELIKKIESLEKDIAINKVKVDDYDKLKLSHDIIVSARKEDQEKVSKAEEVIATFESRENELIQQFQHHQNVMKKDLDSQNETIVNLFDMMDNTINLQVLYYQKYKDIFISVKKKED